MKITVAQGDGIGPQIMESVLSILRQVKAPLEFEMVEMGKAVAEAGTKTGISKEAQSSVESTGILLKGPCETPIGEGYKSVNVTARKLWGTFANKRITRTLPGVPQTIPGPDIHITMVRENIEDTYGGIEHMQTHDVAQCRRLITRPGCEQIHRYTFEMAARKGAQRVTCAHKANIMKLTDGLFRDTFYEVAKDYPDLQVDDVLIDALAMKLVLEPWSFDVIVLPNLQGDILSDLAAGLVGGLAYAPSANVGDGICIFEAVHGTAPDLIGTDRANPTALLLSSTMMLRHVGLTEHATRIEEALSTALHRIHRRPDLGQPLRPFCTSEFTELVLRAIEQQPDSIPVTAAADRNPRRSEPKMTVTPPPSTQTLRGVDVFLESSLSPEALGNQLKTIGAEPMQLSMISNRGTQVWPTSSPFTECVNHYRARFESEQEVAQDQLCRVLAQLSEDFELCGAEWLREIDHQPGYSLAQGQS